VGLIKGYQTKFQLYTVPGQIFYDSTRKMVLKGADGVVFVADSQSLMEGANIESIENLKTNLNEQNQLINELPVVFQFNKRDLNNISPVNRLNKVLNQFDNPYFEAVATSGNGVIETLREISTQTLKKIKDTLDQADHYMEQAPYIHFDANPEKEMMKREDIPVKKIAVDQVEESTSKGSLSDLESDPAYVPPAESFTPEPAADKKEEKPKEKKEIKQETKKGKNPEEKKAASKEEKWEEIVIDDSPFEVAEEKEIFDLKKEYKKSPEFALLDQLKDNSRITIIKRIKLKDPSFTISVSDKNAKNLQNVDVQVTPETKKVTLILDIDS
jgi:signal recognition particle receptor subunit beta